MADLVETLRVIVLPAVAAVFRPGELSSLQLSAEGDSVRVILAARGETYSDEVVQAGVPGRNPAEWEQRLRSNLADFVAESHFGWGQQRDGTSTQD